MNPPLPCHSSLKCLWQIDRFLYFLGDTNILGPSLIIIYFHIINYTLFAVRAFGLQEWIVQNTLSMQWLDLTHGR